MAFELTPPWIGYARHRERQARTSDDRYWGSGHHAADGVDSFFGYLLDNVGTIVRFQLDVADPVPESGGRNGIGTLLECDLHAAILDFPGLGLMAMGFDQSSHA
jgi:hypothetical protein